MAENSDTHTELSAVGPLKHDYSSRGLNEYEEEAADT